MRFRRVCGWGCRVSSTVRVVRGQIRPTFNPRRPSPCQKNTHLSPMQLLNQNTKPLVLDVVNESYDVFVAHVFEDVDFHWDDAEVRVARPALCWNSVLN